MVRIMHDSGQQRKVMVSRNNRKPIVLYIFMISILISFLYGYRRRVDGSVLPQASFDSDELFCHAITTEDSLPDVSDNPPSGQKRSIFFLETSCNSYKTGKIHIKARQACAVESAARMNPNMDIHLLFASPGIIKDGNSESDRIVKVLKSYSNIKMQHFNIDKFVQNSPVEMLWKTKKIKTSLYPMAHTSDILRLVTLWKFGGIYLDLDVIVTKCLETLPDNFGGAESNNVIANGVIGFSQAGKGHEYINECLTDVNQNFDGKNWGYNGPYLITRNIFGHCPQFEPDMLVRFGRCEEFRIFPPSAFYLIPWEKWEWFFNDTFRETIELSAEELSYLIHVWNRLSVDKNIPKSNVNIPYLHMASKYCPGVVKEIDEYF